MTQQEKPQHLIEQVDQYCKTIVKMKQLFVREAQGPADTPSMICVRYGVNMNTETYGLAGDIDEGSIILHEEDGIALCEKHINLTEYASPNESPAPLVFEALSDFVAEYREAAPWTVAVIGDGITVIDDKNPEWVSFRSSPEHASETLHDLFCDEPAAQAWLAECLTVFLMDFHGHMVSCSTRYAYSDSTFPPKPIFEPTEPKYEGNVFEKERSWITDQRIVSQLVLFFASLEEDRHTQLAFVPKNGDEGHTQENPL